MYLLTLLPQGDFGPPRQGLLHLFFFTSTIAYFKADGADRQAGFPTIIARRVPRKGVITYFLFSEACFQNTPLYLVQSIPLENKNETGKPMTNQSHGLRRVYDESQPWTNLMIRWLALTKLSVTMVDTRKLDDAMVDVGKT